MVHSEGEEEQEKMRCFEPRHFHACTMDRWQHGSGSCVCTKVGTAPGELAIANKSGFETAILNFLSLKRVYEKEDNLSDQKCPNFKLKTVNQSVSSTVVPKPKWSL